MLNAHLSALADISSQAHSHLNRLQGVTDTLLGPTPQKAGTNGAEPPFGEGIIGELTARRVDISSALDGIQRELERLEVLAGIPSPPISGIASPSAFGKLAAQANAQNAAMHFDTKPPHPFATENDPYSRIGLGPVRARDVRGFSSTQG